MEQIELKDLLSNNSKFKEWSLIFFNEYSKDEKFITPLDFQNIVTSLSDEYGITVPSKEEIESIVSKREKDQDSYIQESCPLILPKNEDEISLDEYRDKLSVIIEIMIIKLDS